ncbi:MAG: hypothetical protein GXP08_12695 [Gammaproteobacteria bacterium]|nr:hypothetical protein [Gammaproteobacteria bacterium]
MVDYIKVINQDRREKIQRSENIRRNYTLGKIGDRKNEIILGAQQKTRSGNERREVDRRSINNIGVTRSSLEYLIETIKWRSLALSEFTKDKEKKKLMLIISSFGVFSLLATVMITWLSSDKYTGISSIEYVEIFIFTLFIFAVVIINLAIIKFIVSFKRDGLLIVRQINCLRQSVHVALHYLLTAGSNEKIFLAKNNTSEFIKIFKDESSLLYNLYLKHEKYPLDNSELRKAYESDDIIYKSADLFSIFVIALFSFVLIAIPTLMTIFQLVMGIIGTDTTYPLAMFLAIEGVITLLLIFLYTKKVIKESVEEIRKELKKDYSAGFEIAV